MLLCYEPLNKQNEGVVGAVLSAITELTTQKNVDLLSILALEPQLLDDDPLATECWPSIEKLCFDCLENPTNPAKKSDALAVLGHRPDKFIQKLESILKYIASDDDLVHQTAAFLLSFSRHNRARHTQLQKCFDVSRDIVDQKVLDWLRTVLDVPEKVETSYVITNEIDAIEKIRTLISSTWPHNTCLADWQAFDSNKIMDIVISGTLSIADTELGNRCLNYAERVFLPALAGMKFLASSHLKPIDVNRIWYALIEGIRKITEIKQILSHPEIYGGDWNTTLKLKWNHLRQSTLKAASPVRFLGHTEGISMKPPVIEELLPRLFSSPLPLVQDLAKKCIPDIDFICYPATFRESSVIVPVARSLVNEFLRILLDNIVKYSVLNERKCKFSLIGNGKRTLRIEFVNRKRMDVQHGEGTGIPLLEEYALRGRFKFDFYWNKANGEFSTTLLFPEAQRVLPEIQRY